MEGFNIFSDFRVDYNKIRDYAIEKMEEKYGEKFTYITGDYVSPLRSDSELRLKCEKFPEEDITVTVDSDKHVKDNYLAIVRLPELHDMIRGVLDKYFDKYIYIPGTPMGVFDLETTATLSQVLDSMFYYYVSIYVDEWNTDLSDVVDNLKKCFQENRVFLKEIYFYKVKPNYSLDKTGRDVLANTSPMFCTDETCSITFQEDYSYEMEIEK